MSRKQWNFALPRLGRLLLACFLIALPLPAQTLSEYDVEAAYLHDFGKFVTWPVDARNSSPTFDICILGQNPFGGTLDKLISGDQIHGKPIQKRMIGSPAEAAGCAIIYIADQKAPDLPRILNGFNNREALLVSGIPRFAQNGGMIQFVLKGDRVRFSVNLDAAAKCHLTMSSELLKIALSVTGKQRSEETR